MEKDEEAWDYAMYTACRVGFLTSSKELLLYAKAIYMAIMWGKEIDSKANKE